MIKKPQGYDEAQAYTGEAMSLPAGCYVCRIRQVSEAQTQNGRPQVAVLFDIDEGEHKGFYEAQYEAARRLNSSEAKWKGVHKQLMDGSSLPFFKGLMTSIEKSNPGYQFPWGQKDNEKTLIGKRFGAVMGREQFETQDGKRLFATKVFQVRSLEGLKDAKVPEDRLLEDAPASPAPTPSSDPALAARGFMNIPEGIDEELPFM